MSSYFKIYTAKAPVNIALIKYWGKADEKLKIPINDSLSGTLCLDDMCATTTVAISDSFTHNQFLLNDKEQSIDKNSNILHLINEIKKLSNLDIDILNYKIHIKSFNNFPTAAGLASSAAGYSCLAFVLGQVYGVTDATKLSKLARSGSGSASRSLFGGFVHWIKGSNHETSLAQQVVDEKYWPEMRVVICVINGDQKDVSSSEGMLRSVKTSELIDYRANTVVPRRIDEMKKAITDRDFNSFASLTMQDSNQFHAICLDSFPPIFYLNDTSRQVIKICSIINSHYGTNKVAYTFDAGPNACIYLLEDFVPIFIQIMKNFFYHSANDKITDLPIRGGSYIKVPEEELIELCSKIRNSHIECNPNAINYLVNTSIGCGPRLVEEHLFSENISNGRV